MNPEIPQRLHPVTIVYDKLGFDREAIPVVGLERDVAYKLAIRRVVNGGADAIALRLGDEDLQLPSVLNQRIAALVSKQSAFRGADCWGTESIVSAVGGGHAYSPLEDWVTIDQNTHITHTARQLRRVIVKKVVV